MDTTRVIALIVSIGLCLGAGAIGSIYTGSSVKTWYPTLRKPKWNPPSWVFPVVWTPLYICMGIAVWLMWDRGKLFALPGFLFLFQLVLNVIWSYLFFQRRRIDWALAEVFMLWATVLVTMTAFWVEHAEAGLLLLPYWIWLCFATVLNFSVWKLNADRPVEVP